MSNAAEYRILRNIKQRCLNPKNDRYAQYGGRGIYVCDRWRESFSNFYADMGARPSPLHSIDRIDNDGPYAPENCRWAVPAVQYANRDLPATTIFLEHGGVRAPLSHWAAATGIKAKTLKFRLDKGWSAEKVLTTPLRR